MATSREPALKPVFKPVLKIDGAPASGKTARLIQETLRWAGEDGIHADRLYVLCWTSGQHKTLDERLLAEARTQNTGFTPVNVQTWHEFLEQFVRRFSFASPLGHQFTVLTLDETALIVSGLLKTMPTVPDTLRAAVHSAEFARQMARRMDNPHDTTHDIPQALQPFIKTLFDELARRTRQRQLVLPGDVLNAALAMLDNDEIRTQWQAQVQGLLIDDAQELNDAHWRLLSLLSPQTRIALAGNPALTIRANHGARPDNFADTDATETVSLESDSVTSWLAQWQTPAPPAEALRARLTLQRFDDVLDETDALCQWLLTQREQSPDLQWRNCTILIRDPRHGETLLETLAGYRIPASQNGMGTRVLEPLHALYDAASVLHAMERLSISEWRSLHQDLFNTNDAGSYLETLTTLESLRIHLYRLLSTVPNVSGRPACTPLPEQTVQGCLSDITALLEQPGIANALSPLETFHAEYTQHHSVSRLLWQLAEWLQCVAMLGDADAGDTLALGSLFKKTQRLETITQQALDRLLTLTEWLDAFTDLLPDTHNTDDNNAVAILPIAQAQGLHFKIAAIPYMTSFAFPKPGEDDVNEARLFGMALSRGRDHVWISTHTAANAGEPVLPSAFWYPLEKTLQENNNDETATTARAIPKRSYRGEGPWASLTSAPDNSALCAQTNLTLSPSAIKNYMTCPRKFYYKDLLKLPEEDSRAASVGSLVHRLMELFNKDFKQQPHTLARLLALTDRLFDGSEEGFQGKDLRLMARMTPVTRQELHGRVKDAFRDLEAKGYFRHYAHARRILHEEKFETAIPDLPGITWKGRIDALIEREDGRWDVIDYKNYGHGKFAAAKMDTVEKNFRDRMFEPLSDNPDIDSERRFERRLGTTYPVDYQLPIYYMALRQQAPCQNQLGELVLQLIRPPHGDNPVLGSIRLAYDVSDSARMADLTRAITADLKRYVCDPLQSAAAFETRAGQHCKQCSYLAICDSNYEAGSDEGDGDDD